nr:DUF1016 N-terminal domain-containing protein [Capnocytophaga granulosa]
MPWGHHIMIIQRCKSIQEALFYVHKTIENHWSRSVLEHQIALKDSNHLCQVLKRLKNN